jgi:hypothetical protein
MTEDDIAEAERLIALPGGPGSGRVRYGAAMRLWAAGRLSAADVESWRIASPHDAAQAPPTPAAAIDHLVAEATDYLSALPGPGIAEVRAGLAHWRSPPTAPTPRPNAIVGRWLPDALAAMDNPTLATAIAAAAPHLHWITYDSYPPTDIGPHFPRAHAYATMIGEGAPIPARDFDLGLFLIAPGTFYRDHRHPAPELYAPLTGPHLWRFHPGAPLTPKPAHTPVWNPPLQHHATKVGTVPFLCLFVWTRDVNLPATVIPCDDWDGIES